VSESKREDGRGGERVSALTGKRREKEKERKRERVFRSKMVSISMTFLSIVPRGTPQRLKRRRQKGRQLGARGTIKLRGIDSACQGDDLVSDDIVIICSVKLVTHPHKKQTRLRENNSESGKERISCSKHSTSAALILFLISVSHILTHTKNGFFC
jgi:hypothetical protein